VFHWFIARQAILKDNLTLLGCDLQFRAEEASAGATDCSSAAYLTDSSTMVFRWESFTGNGLAFIPLGLQELLSGAALILPRTKTVIEIPSSLPCTAEVVFACKSLKTAGYRLSLGGWAADEERRPLVDLADYLRVDVHMLQPFVQETGQREGKTALIAGDVDTWEDHRKVTELGIRYCPGRLS